VKIETKFDVGDKVSFPFEEWAGDYCPHCDRGDSKRKSVIKNGVVDAIEIKRHGVIKYAVDVPESCTYLITENDLNKGWS
jgi:hypothetical protein